MQELDYLQRKAGEIITVLNDIPVVKGCTIYGSLSTNTHDTLSDIDIEIDVSGHDNGQFMMDLNGLLKDKIKIFYSDYAPSLIPEKYIVSIAIDEYNPFLVVDLCCTAKPHCTTVTRQQARERNDNITHLLKLWTANLKHYIRGSDCHHDMIRMGQRLSFDNLTAMDDKTILEVALCWLENHVDDRMQTFVRSCRAKFKELVK